MSKHAAAVTELMNLHQLTPNSLSVKSGVPYATLYRLLNDSDASPQVKTIEKLALFFGVTPAVIRGETAADAEPLSPQAMRLVAVIRRADRNRYLSESTAEALVTLIDRLR